MSIWKATGGWSCAISFVDGVTLDENDAERVLQHLANLWGYEVHLIESTADGEQENKLQAEPVHPFM